MITKTEFKTKVANHIVKKYIDISIMHKSCGFDIDMKPPAWYYTMSEQNKDKLWKEIEVIAQKLFDSRKEYHTNY